MARVPELNADRTYSSVTLGANHVRSGFGAAPGHVSNMVCECNTWPGSLNLVGGNPLPKHFEFGPDDQVVVAAGRDQKGVWPQFSTLPLDWDTGANARGCTNA